MDRRHLHRDDASARDSFDLHPLMLVVNTWLQPSAVSHSLRCHLTSDDRECLVVAKVNRLEVYDLTAEGLEYRCCFDAWATITSLIQVPRKVGLDPL